MATGIGAIVSGLVTMLGLGSPIPGALAAVLMGLSSFWLMPNSMPIEAMAQPDFDLATFESLIVADATEEQAMQMLYEVWDLDSLGAANIARIRVLLEARLIGDEADISFPAPASLLVQPLFYHQDAKVLSAPVLSLENARMREAVFAIESSELIIPEAVHDQLITAILAQEAIDPETLNVLDTVLALLARRGPHAREAIEALRSDPRAELGLLRAEAALAGVPEPWEVLWDGRPKTEAMHAYEQLQGYAINLEWGGHLGYFGIDDSKNFPAALRALKQHGHSEAFKVARQAALMLNPDGWSRHVDRRSAEINQLDDEQKSQMLALDQEASARRREILACSYEVVLANLSDFGGEAR